MQKYRKTSTSAHAISNEATHIAFATRNNTLSGNNQPYGSLSVSQSVDGVMFSNVQAAIDDIASIATSNVNTVVINTDGITPAPSSQIDRIKLTGVVALDGHTSGDSVIFNFLGFDVPVLVGDTAVDVTNKVIAALQKPVADRMVFSSVRAVSSDRSVIELVYLDSSSHSIQPYTHMGISIAQTIVSPAKPGSGTWEKLGTETKTLAGARNSITLHYFRRTS